MQPIYQIAKTRFNLVMALTINEIRKTNLLILIDEVGKKSTIAKLADTDPAYISQVLSENPKHSRNIGEDFARKLENGCGKPRGWMDQYHPRNAVGNLNATLEGVGGHFQGQINNNLAALIATSSPNTRSILETLAKADQEGYLTDQDLKLLESIIQRLTSPHPLRKREKPSYGKLLDEAQKNHSSE
ncbi:hypothetical protein [Methylomonas rapida]|uniref:Uncharacterized protein n=1 Tax=Methylomonas rapida TaxID=2963939 RepID=A0ABY7GQZ9_9GAMM|nr:hypothetical protein [Methylomonas rapida]WAR46936.1 hypothetical protein NM686_010615 [Methylomonas rapida]